MSSIYSKNIQKIIINSQKLNKRLLFNKKNFKKHSNFKENSYLLEAGYSSYLKNGVKYLFTIGLGVSAGVATGYWLLLDVNRLALTDENEDIRSLKLINDFKPTIFIEHKDSPYSQFPLTFHLYQYECCPYCSQIRTYLDYFGFNYHLTEVDPYDKKELNKLTKARTLPILVLEDKLNKKKWYLSNATAILSALESIRNDKHINFVNILDQYLPILKGNSVNTAKLHHKYKVSNSDLNSIEWRKWINNNAIPVFKLNAIDNLKDLFERFDNIAERSSWRSRYNNLKYLYIYYFNAYKAYNEKTHLIEQIDLNNRSNSPRQMLHDVLNKWEQGLGDNQFISGTDKPNLADFSMFGNVRSYEGCALFRESIAKHPKFKAWYEKMKYSVVKGYQRFDKKSIAYLVESLDENLEEKKETKPDLEPESKPELSKPVQKIDTETQTNLNATTIAKEVESGKAVFRILTVTYIFHVLAFAYAAWMAK